jgi:urease accessory protein
VITRVLTIPEVTASRLFLYVHLRGLVSAAVRLGIVGPLQGQALQHSMATRGEGILQRCRQRSIDAVAQTAPLLDLWQANQDRLYSRLFQS